MITVEEAKAHCRIDDDADDALVQSIISAAFAHIENRTGQTFNRVDNSVMVLDALPSGSDGIELQWTPVRSVTSVEYLDPQGAQQTIASDSLFLDTRGVYPIVYPDAEADWPDSKSLRGSVKVIVDTGHSEVPYDVKAAALLIVGHLYENRESVVIGTISSELPMGVSALLGPYKIDAVG